MAARAHVVGLDIYGSWPAYLPPSRSNPATAQWEYGSILHGWCRCPPRLERRLGSLGRRVFCLCVRICANEHREKHIVTRYDMAYFYGSAVCGRRGRRYSSYVPPSALLRSKRIDGNAASYDIFIVCLLLLPVSSPAGGFFWQKKGFRMYQPMQHRTITPTVPAATMTHNQNLSNSLSRNIDKVLGSASTEPFRRHVRCSIWPILRVSPFVASPQGLSQTPSFV